MSELLSPEEPTDIIMDHQNLQTFMTTKALTLGQVRWANFLSQFNFKIQYRPGKKNGKADYLSRMPGVMPKGGGENLDHRLQRIFKDENLDPELREIAAELQTLVMNDSSAAVQLNALTIAVDEIQDQPTVRELLGQAYPQDANLQDTLHLL